MNAKKNPYHHQFEIWFFVEVLTHSILQLYIRYIASEFEPDEGGFFSEDFSLPLATKSTSTLSRIRFNDLKFTPLVANKNI